MFLDDLEFIKGIAALESEANDLTWKYVHVVKDKKASENFAVLMGLKYLPKELHKLMMAFSNGRPSKRVIKVSGREVMINNVLSLNEEDKANAFKMYEALRDKIPKNSIPFMATFAGDYVLMSTSGTIHVWLHETGKTVKVAKSLDEFLNKLQAE